MKSNQTFAIAANQAGDFGRQRLATVQIVEGKDFESKQLVRCIVLGQQNGGAGTVAKLLNDGEVVFVDEPKEVFLSKLVCWVGLRTGMTFTTH